MTGQTLTDVFVYTMTDTAGATSQATIIITITGANDNPVAVDDTGTAIESGGLNNGTTGASATGNVLTNDTDVDSVANGETKTVVDFATIFAPATTVIAGNSINGNYGSITIGTNGAYTYTIDETNASVQALRVTGQTLTDAFVYTMTDTAGATSQAIITITITGVNDTPVAVDDTGTAIESGGFNNGSAGSNTTGNVLTNDTDVDSVANGETKTVIHFAAVSAPATTVTAGNSINGNFGSIAIGLNGVFTYTIDEANAAVQALRVTGQTLTDAFIYTMTDTAGATSQATLTITITGANDTPIAVDDTGIAFESGGVNNGTAGSNATGNVLTNDTDVDSFANGETKTVVDFATVVAQATTVPAGNSINGSYGAITIGANGAYTYTIDDTNAVVQSLHVTGQTLIDAFVYTMTDTAGATSQATLTITIQGENDAPTGLTLTSATLVENTKTSNGLPLGQLQAFDPDASDSFNLQIVGGPDANRFSLSADPVPQLIFNDGDIDFERQTSYTAVIRIIDRGGASFDQAFTVTILDLNEAPVAVSNQYALFNTYNFQVSAQEGVLKNDLDPDQNLLKAVFVTGPAHGKLSLAADGSFTYIPDSGFLGSDQFTYLASDGALQSDPVTVTIIVDQLVIAPVAPVVPSSSTGASTSTQVTTTSTPSDSKSMETSPTSSGGGVDALQAVLLEDEATPETSHQEPSVVQVEERELVTISLAPQPAISNSDSVPSWGEADSSHNALAALPQLRHASLQLDTLRGYATNYDSSYLWNQMNLMEEHQRAYGEWSNSFVVGSSVVAASGFTLGVVLWSLRAGYLVMLVSSALPTWAGFDPIPVLDHEALTARDLSTTKRQKSLAEIL